MRVFRKKGEKEKEKDKDEEKGKGKGKGKGQQSGGQDDFAIMFPPEMERVESDPKGVGHKLKSGKRRLKQRVVNTVKQGGLDDAAFQARKSQVFAIRDNVKELGKRTKGLLGQCRAMCQAADFLGQWALNMGTNDQKLASAMGILDTKVRGELEHGMIQCLDSLALKLKPFEELERRIEKRHRFVLDFDSYTRKVRALKENPKSEPNKVLDKEMKLQRSSERLEHATKELYKAFDYYTAIGGRLVVPELMLLKQAQLKFFTMCTETFSKVEIADPTKVTEQLEGLAQKARPTPVPPIGLVQNRPAGADAAIDMGAQMDFSRRSEENWDHLPATDISDTDFSDNEDTFRPSSGKQFDLDSPSKNTEQASHGFVFHSAHEAPPPGMPPQRKPTARKVRGTPPFELGSQQNQIDDPFADSLPQTQEAPQFQMSSQQNQVHSTPRQIEAQDTPWFQMSPQQNQVHDPFAVNSNPIPKQNEAQETPRFQTNSLQNQVHDPFAVNSQPTPRPNEESNRFGFSETGKPSQSRTTPQNQPAQPFFDPFAAQVEHTVANNSTKQNSTDSNFHQSGFPDAFPNAMQQQQKQEFHDPFAEISSISQALPAQSPQQNASVKMQQNLTNPAPQPSQSPSQPHRKQLRARALYAYEAADHTELSFDHGEIILILNQENSGWWEGQTRSGKKGLLPSNYVEMIA